jgi:hypothetical protein
MSEPAAWEVFLAESFPGYLLPESSARALSEEAAACFLARLGAPEGQLFVLRAASVISAHLDELRELALSRLPALARDLPPRTVATRQVSEGAVRGRLDVPATLQRRSEGRLTELVSRALDRRLDRPENVLLKAVVRRLAGVLSTLGGARVVSGAGWGAALPDCEAALRRALAETALRDVADAPVTPVHERAALEARHPAYRLGLRLHRALAEGLDSRSPEVLARAVAAGALLPLADHTRFELAVLLRLMEALERRLEGFVLERTILREGRREVASFEREDGAGVRLHYDQACLDPGPYDEGIRRYFGQRGRLRPDLTVVIAAPGAPPRAVVIEAKLSSDPGYLVQGYREALVYRAEYAASLSGWPKAILVASSPIAGAPSRADEVIAVDWDRWVPDVVLDGLVEGFRAM